MSDNKHKIIIAIDGFSSCGKSTFAKAIARELGYIFSDTYFKYDENFWRDFNVIPLEEEISKLIEKISLKIEEIGD